MTDTYASPIIATFHDPDDKNYSFENFTKRWKGEVLSYPGRLTAANTFRIGVLGDLTVDDISLIIEGVLDSMKEWVTNNNPIKSD